MDAARPLASHADPGPSGVPVSLSAAASLTPAGVGAEVGSLFALTVDIGSASRPVDEHLLKEFCLGFSWGSICGAGCCWGTVEPPHLLRSLCRLPLASHLPEHSDVRWKLTWSAAQTSKQVALG